MFLSFGTDSTQKTFNDIVRDKVSIDILPFVMIHTVFTLVVKQNCTLRFESIAPLCKKWLLTATKDLVWKLHNKSVIL